MKWKLKNPANVLLPVFLFVILENFYGVNIAAGDVIEYESKEHVYPKKIKNLLRKNFHPVIRILLIFDNKLFLKKNDFTDYNYPDKWDISVSGHLLYGETYEDCISRLLRNMIRIQERDRGLSRSQCS